MQEQNLLDDNSLEGQVLGAWRPLTSSMSTWLRILCVLSMIITALLIINGSLFLVYGMGSRPILLLAALIAFFLAGLWSKAFQYQFKAMHWLYRLATHQTKYERHHWVYLNSKLWQWTGVAVVISPWLGILAIIGIE